MPSANKKKTLGRADVRKLKKTQRDQVLNTQFLGEMKTTDGKISSYLIECSGYDSVVAIRRFGPFNFVVIQTVMSKDGKRIIADTIGKEERYGHVIDTAVNLDIERVREQENELKKDKAKRFSDVIGVLKVALATVAVAYVMAYAGAGSWVAEIISK